MINHHSHKRFKSVERKSEFNTEKPQANSGKINIENKSGTNNNKLNLPRNNMIKQKSSENFNLINVSTNKDSGKSDLIVKDNYGAVSTNVDILEDLDKNVDSSFSTNKKGNKFSRHNSKERSDSKNHLKRSNSKEFFSVKPSSTKKQVKFIESKESIKDISDKNCGTIKEIDVDLESLCTNNEKTNSEPILQVEKKSETTNASKLTLKDIKKEDSKGSHQRTKTFATNFVFESRDNLKKLEENKKPLLLNNQLVYIILTLL